MPAQDIYSNQLRPKSVQDFDAENIQAQTARQGLQQNALNLQLSRQKADEYTSGIGRQTQIRNALLGLGANATDEARIAALKGTATPEGFTQADALEKAGLERQKTAAETAYKGSESKKAEAAEEKDKFNTQSGRMAYQAQRALSVLNFSLSACALAWLVCALLSVTSDDVFCRSNPAFSSASA